MKIIYWADFSCPYCYIALTRVKRALREMNLLEQTELRMKSFELEPDAPIRSDEPMLKHFARQYKMNEIDARNHLESLMVETRIEGIEMHLLDTVPVNTFNAHRVLKMAQSKKKQELADRLVDQMFAAYFVQGKDISDLKVLQQIAAQSGLLEDEVETVLQSKAYRDAVQRDREGSRILHVEGVPYFAVNGRYALQGVQSLQDIKRTIRRAMNDEFVAQKQEGVLPEL